MSTNGFVYIVGAGPGNPDLITVQGRRYLRRADVVLHDRLIQLQLLHEARVDAIVVDVGKQFGHEDAQQHLIHSLMIDYARKGNTVCRLKGGDPFVFGRGGEEIAVLKAAGIPYEVVPGVSSITAAPATAGVPLTHRAHTHGFLIIAGSKSADFNTPEWQAARTLLKAGGTVVVLMGLGRIDAIMHSLRINGCASDTPVAVISHATLPTEEVRWGAISNIEEKSNGMKTPAVLLIGGSERDPGPYPETIP